MKIEADVQWVPGNWTTGTGTVTDYKEVLNDGKKDKQLHFSCEGSLYRMSIWGSNINACISRWGNDTDLWKGKHFFLIREAKPNEKAKLILSPQ